MGNFIARSLTNLIHLPYLFLLAFPLYEIGNAVVFFFHSTYVFIPHISIIFGLVLMEGLVAGMAYAKTYFMIHKEVRAWNNFFYKLEYIWPKLLGTQKVLQFLMVT